MPAEIREHYQANGMTIMGNFPFENDYAKNFNSLPIFMWTHDEEQKKKEKKPTTTAKRSRRAYVVSFVCVLLSQQKCFLSHINLIMDPSNKLLRSLTNWQRARCLCVCMQRCDEKLNAQSDFWEYEISTRSRNVTHRRHTLFLTSYMQCNFDVFFFILYFGSENVNFSGMNVFSFFSVMAATMANPNLQQQHSVTIFMLIILQNARLSNHIRLQKQ